MGLSKTQMDDLLKNIQYFLDNPVKQIDWKKISQQFSDLLEQGVEYDEEEIQYALRKLLLPDGIDLTSIYVIADELLTNYKINKNLKSEMADFEKNNKELVAFLRNLKFPRVNNHVLTYESDHWFLMDGFEKLLEKRIRYNTDDIRKWLSFNKSANGLENNVIEDIARIAEFTQINYNRSRLKGQ